MASSDAVKVLPISTVSDFNTRSNALPSKALLVLYFHAPWAAPCAQMADVLDALASTYQATDPPSISFLSVNAEELPDISEEHDVTAVPFIVLRRDGKTIETISGSDAAKVRAAVEKHAGSGSGAGRTNAQLPPAQQVKRPAQQPLPATTANGDNANATKISSTNGGSGAAKDLSAYAPDKQDPATAPEYSSSTKPGLTASSTSDNTGTGEDDINKRLTELTNAAPCMLFMKGTPSAPQCGFSRQLVSILREKGVRYGFFNILADDEVRQGLKTFADWPTFPQLWLQGELVGGLDIVREELDNDSTFFDQFSVDPGSRNKGGPAAPENQVAPAAA